MAAVVASKPAAPQPKMRKPSLPVVQTNTNGVRAGQPPSSSPSSAAKRLPSQPPPATPVSATPNSANANPSRPNRRQQRQSTKVGTQDNLPIDRKTAKKYPEPFVPTQAHILKKFKGRPPSLIVHLHPTHFRFDQQDGSFSYHSEMRMFIEHLKAGTIPHDMVEEFRKSEVQLYDGWLIVRVIDHCTIKNSVNGSGNATDDGKPFSIHNYNQYITPSPYAPYPTKEQIGQRSPQIKQDPQNKENQNSDARSDDTVSALPKPNKPQPKVYHVGLRPTNLSRQMDLALDALAPDPKSINRKQSQANVNSRGGAPPTPISGVPSTPATERAPQLKKQKLKIDAKDLLEYEARVINATAPPLYLEVPDSYEEAEAVIAMLRDPLHNAPPPTAKSRKRTFAELAADDAQAKETERFMLIMDERNPNNTVGTNAAAADAQAGAGIFQPRFEKFNALENIKREIAERKQRDKDRQMQEDEARRGMQAEEDRRQHVMRQRELQQLRIRQQNEMQQRAHQQAAQQVAAQNQRQQQQQQQQQASSIPPAMQNQMMQSQQRSSPLLRQGTPHGGSSPVVNNPQAAQAMAPSVSQQGAGSPPRPGSAVPHGHPGIPMARGPSAQGPSRNGTPQIPHSTPGVRNATPVMRQGTPAQHMTQASPHGSMMAPTPQMQAVAMQGQGQQQQFTQQQINAFQNRQAQIQAAAQMRGQPMVNGQMNPAQFAQMHAHQQREAAMRNLQQQQQHMQQQQQQGTPHQQMQSPAQASNQYKAQMQEQARAQMAALQQGQTQGSPAPQHMTPQQQAAQLAHQQQQRMMQQQQTAQQHPNAMVPQQMTQQQMQAQQQQRSQIPVPLQNMYQAAFRNHQSQYMQQAAAKYGGNMQLLQPPEVASVRKMASEAAWRDVNRRKQAMVDAHMRQQAAQQAQAQQNGMMGMQGINANMNMQGQGQGQQGQPGQQVGGGGVGGGGGGNMQAQQAMQQQAAVNMQHMQMAHAAHMMAQAQQQGGGGGGGGGVGNANQASMASIQQYQQQLQQMQQQRQG